MKFLFKDEEHLRELSEDALAVFMGVDEVGRGPLAGPVVACSVALYFESKSSGLSILSMLNDQGIADSKKLSPKKRQQILQNLNIDVSIIENHQTYIQLKQHDAFLIFTLNLQPPKVIDEINILEASLLCMKNATTANLSFLDKANVELKAPITIWIDGNKGITLEKNKRKVSLNPVVKGDQNYLLVALASIIAKEYRDLFMVNLGCQFPQYGFQKHSGYGTKMHIENIKRFGVSSVHRKTFVKNFVEADEHKLS
ncbi:MAG: ribonuclease HII [Bacteriovoracaceae bacterium]